MSRLLSLVRATGASQVRHSTIRMRIALVYGGVFLVLGTALLTTVNLASRAGTDSQARAIATSAAVAQPGFAVNGPLHARGGSDRPRSTTSPTTSVTPRARSSCTGRPPPCSS